jgi:hypothetical protein
VSIDPAIFRAMVANGATPEMLLAVVEAAAAVEEEKRARKRAGNAERQQRFRDARKADRNTDNALQVVTTRDERDLPPNDIYSNPPSSPSDTSSEVSVPHDFSDGDPIELRPEHVVEAWNAMAAQWGLPKAKLTPERRRKLAVRIRQHSVEDFTEAIQAIGRSPFLRGENDRAWRADFDFLLQPKSFTRLIEGSYDRATH